ncbi:MULTISPECIES: MlaD family protein [Gordonia]|uniref:Mammalian cell entry protein n=1 Tax=Gordonia alkanivorans CGMCC 6845 TaxID=1423140 RepID=W9D9S2_9ACTN|nr:MULTISPECIES: MCE family protein [Gordonia]AZZ81815.1 MCE family protein [Gordonia alkanivorans]ETA05107.1 mammalian cell entry protein [Gordonia alkanivorans CGMCC 6845]MDH3007990.1 MCE family protein [Gordonia alkanivorans]MDH3012062.1 MCE family protein [Gordonia alkanivorans]MDH3016649.1 MCE family protein [Gordonia alkanivorans]
MNIATDGRNPSLMQFVLRGIAFLLVLLVIFVLLFMRYQGTFSKTVGVTADLVDIGDGLTSGADVRYNGLIVGSVKSISVGDSGDRVDAAKVIKKVEIDIVPAQAEGIPASVTARTVPSNLFGVNSVELVRPAEPGTERLSSGDSIPADTSLETIKLQDAQNELNAILDAVPPEELAQVLGVVADALKGGGSVFGSFVGVLRTYFDAINAQFPPGAPPGFDNFDAAISGLAESSPELLDALGRSVIPAVTIAEKQRDLAALLSGNQGLLDQLQLMFARNGNGGQRLVTDLNRMLGATVLEPNSLPQAVIALNNLAARVLTVFTGTNGHVQLNIGVSFGAFVRYTRQNCPVYNGGPYGTLRGPGCVGPGTGTGPTMSGPLRIYPSDGMRKNRPVGMVTTDADNKTLGAVLRRAPSAADTIMLGPLVQSIDARDAATDQGGGR